MSGLTGLTPPPKTDKLRTLIGNLLESANPQLRHTHFSQYNTMFCYYYSAFNLFFSTYSMILLKLTRILPKNPEEILDKFKNEYNIVIDSLFPKRVTWPNDLGGYCDIAFCTICKMFDRNIVSFGPSYAEDNQIIFQHPKYYSKNDLFIGLIQLIDTEYSKSIFKDMYSFISLIEKNQRVHMIGMLATVKPKHRQTHAVAIVRHFERDGNNITDSSLKLIDSALNEEILVPISKPFPYHKFEKLFFVIHGKYEDIAAIPNLLNYKDS